MLGFSAFSEFSFAQVAKDNSVTITLAKNELTISIGNPGITADAITEIPDGSQVVLGIGSVTLTADANVTGVKNELVLGTGTVTVTADANVTAVKNELVISSGTVTITADANVTPAVNALTLATGTAQAITWSEIVPGATMTWTPIDPT
jgi:lipopolysaccharide export system protein LptA